MVRAEALPRRICGASPYCRGGRFRRARRLALIDVDDVRAVEPLGERPPGPARSQAQHPAQTMLALGGRLGQPRQVGGRPVSVLHR